MLASRWLLVSASLLGALSARPVLGTFHFMQIEQVIGGVNGNTSAQAIQLRMRFAGQNLVAQARLRVADAAGQNPITVINFTSNVPNGAAGARILVVSPTFSNFTSPPAAPNFVMTNPIPASYLAAGTLTFESDSGIVYWRLSWGGAAYTGPGNGALDNDLDGNFNPPFPGPLPSTGVQALQFQGPANALSTNNAADYALTPGAAVFVNNAGASFTVSPPAPTGACCAPGNPCQVTTQAACGGSYIGDNTTCSPDPCLGLVCDESNPNECVEQSQVSAPGCNAVECCLQICGVDPFCCQVAWDSACANQADSQCQEPPLNRSVKLVSFEFGSGPGLFNVIGNVSLEVGVLHPVDMSSDYAVFVNGLSVGTVGERIATICPGANDCTGTNPPCAGKACPQVSWPNAGKVDGTCIKGPWGKCKCNWTTTKKKNNVSLVPGDQVTFVAVAVAGAEPEVYAVDDSLTVIFQPPSSVCHPSNPNDCCVPSQVNMPGCNNPVCCQVICASDPFCCEVSWDPICVDQAQASPQCGCFADCNGNGIPDEQDIHSGQSRDCNGNQVPDECDLEQGESQDVNRNNLPDECEPACCRIERRGDWDDDCDVDLLDFSTMQICLPRHPPEEGGGAGGCFADGCVPMDINYDGAIDLFDYGDFAGAISVGGPGSSLPDCDPGGGSCDAWATGSPTGLPFGGTYYVFGDPLPPVPPGYDGDNPPIPAGFFAPGSLPFDGVVILKGQASDAYNFGSTDTIIEHPPLRFGFGDLPLCDIVPARLESLNLRSSNPIVVDQSVAPGDCNGNGIPDATDIAGGASVDQNGNGVPDECEWYVAAVRSQVLPPDGTIEACKTTDNGGTFNATILIQPLFIFVNKAELDAGAPLSPDSVKTLDTGLEGLPPIIFEFFDQPFVVCAPDTAMYQTPCSQGNFVPGVTDNSPLGPTTCMSHISPGESHYFCPPECFTHLCTYPAVGVPFAVPGSCGAGCAPPTCPAFPASLLPSDTGIPGMDTNCVGPDASMCPMIGYFEISNFDPAVGMTADCLLPPPAGCFPMGLCLQGYGSTVTCTNTGTLTGACP